MSRMISFMSLEDITEKLQDFLNDPNMHTESSYSPAAIQYEDNKLPFVEYHLLYLQSHKNVNPEHYLSNLSLMIKKR